MKYSLLNFKSYRYCDTESPSNFVSTSDELHVKFHSDPWDSHGFLGFLISYNAVTRHCSNTDCKEGEGYCATDSECEASLVCGQYNCVNDTMHNCCTKLCNNHTDCLSQECDIENNQCRLGTYWSKCTLASLCNEGEGDCDVDSECKGSLVCGKDNCGSGAAGMDCCAIYTGKYFKDENSINCPHLILYSRMWGKFDRRKWLICNSKLSK